MMRLMFFNLLLGQLLMNSDIVVGNGEDIKDKYLNSIDEIFYRTAVERTTQRIKYCIDNLRHTQQRVIDDVDRTPDLEEVIKKYSHLPNVNEVTLNDTSNPVTEYGVLYLNGQERIPLYVKADIRARHLRPAYTFSETRKDVERQMILMRELDSDDKGHLLAPSLGGASSALNIVPIAHNVNQHYVDAQENITLKFPGSNFRSNEDWIQKFLTRYPNGRVTWTLACQYRRGIFTNSTKNHDYRPVRFALEFTAYTNQHDEATVYLKRSPLTYLNNNEFGCEYEESLRRHKRSDVQHLAKHIAKMSYLQNSKCITHEENGLQGMARFALAKFIAIIYYPDKGQCGLGAETVTRNSGDDTADEVARGVVTTYMIGGRRYYYLIDDTAYFTYELYANGTSSLLLKYGDWKQPYRTVLTYHVNGRAFLYGCNNETNDWVIRELFVGGKVGNKLSQGTWKHKCQLTFTYECDGKNYFYTQSGGDKNYWWIQELLPEGEMGRETDRGYWNEDYQLLIPIEINEKNFFLRHNHENKSWYSTELLPRGKMGKVLFEGTFHVRFAIAFPFVIVRDCKHYFLAHSVLDTTEWFIYELLPSGQIGNMTCSGDFGQRCPTAFRYEIQDRHFFYRRCMDTLKLYIQQLF